MEAFLVADYIVYAILIIVLLWALLKGLNQLFRLVVPIALIYVLLRHYPDLSVWLQNQWARVEPSFKQLFANGLDNFLAAVVRWFHGLLRSIFGG